VHEVEPRPRRAGGLALGGLALCIAAPFAWAFTLDNAFLRSTGAASWVCLALGIALAVTAARADRRRWVRVSFGVDVAIVAVFAVTYFTFPKLPAAQSPALERAPDFELTASDGARVHLADELTRGPVLLVFYRGYW
jgi:hypothetical protein